MDNIQRLSALDWGVIALFFTVTISIGLYFSRRGKGSLTDYFVAGRKMTWWVAGTSIVATTFASDTPLVISSWVRTVGIEKNWFWWGSIMGMMLCTFFFARLWRRAKIITDVEFNELRYTGKPAAGLRMFHATYGALIKNTIIMGWVTLAMTKILDVTLDIPTLVFVKGQLLPLIVPKGVEVGSVVDIARIINLPLLGDTIVPAKVSGIILCFSVAVLYSAISGLWGVLATDFFQFILAMTGSLLFMTVIFTLSGGPSELVRHAKETIVEGQVINQARKSRYRFKSEEILKIAPRNPRLLLENGTLERDPSAADRFLWADPKMDLKVLEERLSGASEKTRKSVVSFWEQSFTISKACFTDFDEVAKMLDAGLLIESGPGESNKVDYYRVPDVSLSEAQLLEALSAAGVYEKSEFLAAWRHDKIVHSKKVSSFMPPFDLKGGGLLAIWSFLVFVGLQWWTGAQGSSFLAQRLFSCKNEKHSVMAMLWFNLAHFALRPWPWIVVGIASIWLVPDVTRYGPEFDAEHAYVIMLMKVLPVGVRGILVAALMAAFMSTISTQVNLGASYVINDLYKRFIHRSGSQRHDLLVSQIATFILAAVAGLYAFASSSIATGWFVVIEIMSGAGLVLLARWYWWRVNAWSELSGMFSSLLLYALLNWTRCFHSLFGLLGAPEYLVDEYAVRFTLNIVFSTILWVTVTLLTSPEDEEHLIRFYKRVRPAGFWKPIAIKAGNPDHLVIGWIEWTCWALGSTGLLAAVLGFGNLCLGVYRPGILLLAYGVAASFFVMRLVQRMDWSETAEQA